MMAKVSNCSYNLGVNGQGQIYIICLFAHKAHSSYTFFNEV